MMSQIFVSHSARDEEIVNFFLKIFSLTNVRGVWHWFICRGLVVGLAFSWSGS